MVVRFCHRGLATRALRPALSSRRPAAGPTLQSIGWGVALKTLGALLWLMTAPLTSQQLVKDPYFTDQTAWQPLNALSASRILRWAPLTINVTAFERTKLGVSQIVIIPKAGWYQIAATGRTWHPYLGLDSLPFYAAMGPLSTSAPCSVGPDTAMDVKYLEAGSYTLEVFSLSIWATGRYESIMVACFVRPVELPCPNWDVLTPGWPGLTTHKLWGMFAPGTDSALYMVSAQRLSTGLTVPGIQGQLVLDPVRDGGITFLPLLTATGYFWLERYGALPALHAQILAIDVKNMTFTLGSRTYSLP